MSGADGPEAKDGAAPGREAAFFDLDKTVIAKASIAAFRTPFYDEGLIDRRALLKVVFGQVVYLHLGASEQRLARMRESVLKLTRGWERSLVREIVEETLEEAVEPIIFAEAMDLIEQHRAEGRLIVLVSASPEEIVEPLGRFLAADRVIASSARVDASGRYTGSMAFYAYGPFKAEAMHRLAVDEGIDLSRSYAYSDSYTDVPMLEAVGHPVVVNPDRVLSRLAREREWPVLAFVSPVRLRDRVRDRLRESQPPPHVVISLGAIALGAAALGIGVWLGSRRTRRRVAAGPAPTD